MFHTNKKVAHRPEWSTTKNKQEVHKIVEAPLVGQLDSDHNSVWWLNNKCLWIDQNAIPIVTKFSLSPFLTPL